MRNAVIFCLCLCIPLLTFSRGERIQKTTETNSTVLPVPNDDCSTAMSMAVPSSYSGTTLGANTGIAVACTDPMGGGTGGNGNYDVWFTFVGTGNDLELSVCNANTGFDTKMAVYMGSGCFSMTCVAANDDYALDLNCYIGPSARKSKIILSSILNNVYFVRLDGYGVTDLGDYTFSIVELLPAPVTLVDIWGEPWERGNTISWETSSEENVQWHIIERSADGRKDWNEVGRMVSHGQKDHGAIYELIDNEPFSETYYRLRTVDYDASEQISKSVIVKRETSDFEAIRVYPNPIQNEVNFKIDSDREEEMKIRIVDLSGKRVAEYSEYIREGINEFNLNTASWKAGIYFAQFRSRQAHVTRRIVKQDL